jgi:hypothetical protein
MTFLIALAEAISLSITPLVCFDPCDVKVKIRVEDARDNKAIAIEIEGDGAYYRYSEFDHKEGAPKAIEIWYKALPEGNYTIRTVLIKEDKLNRT